MRKHIKFPDNWTEILDNQKVDTPRLRWKGPNKGDPFPKGTRLKEFGMTPEERLMNYAPVESTVPEKLVYGWLVTHDIPFKYQEQFFGGRLPGGAIVDFMIFEVSHPIALRIMSFWHEAPEMQWHDEVQRGMLMEMDITVTDVYEHEINTADKLDIKMMEVLYGLNLGGGVLNISEKYAVEGTDCPYCDDILCSPCNLPGV